MNSIQPTNKLCIDSSELTREPGESSSFSRIHNKVALIAICLGYFMIILDTTIVNIALVNMQQQLGASVNDLQWVVDGYTLVFASLLLTAGALGDRFGNKRLFLTGLALFIFASALCGTAPALLVLELTRLLQGIGAALMLPASLALLNTLSDDSQVRARNIGIWGGIAGIAALSGPLVGGILVNAFGWRSIFLVNIPIGVLALVLTWRFVTAVASRKQGSIDLLAQLTGIVALAARKVITNPALCPQMVYAQEQGMSLYPMHYGCR